MVEIRSYPIPTQMTLLTGVKENTVCSVIIAIGTKKI